MNDYPIAANPETIRLITFSACEAATLLYVFLAGAFNGTGLASRYRLYYGGRGEGGGGGGGG